MDELQPVEVEMRAFAVQVDGLAGVMPFHPHALQHLLHRPPPQRQVRMRLGDESVRVIEQRERQEDRQILPELAMQRGRRGAGARRPSSTINDDA